MSSPTAAKIILVGPQKSGKTILANFLSDYGEEFVATGDYEPTVGCRILEFERNVRDETGRQFKLEIELWDCSGDHKYASGWPAMRQHVDGVVFVFNPDQPSDEADLPMWYDWFVRSASIDVSRCLCMAIVPGRGRTPRLPDEMRDVQLVELTYSSGSRAEKAFSRWLPNVVSSWQKRTQG